MPRADTSSTRNCSGWRRPVTSAGSQASDPPTTGRGYPTAVPYVLYRDHAAASRWIAEVLGFRETIQFTVPNGGPVGHVELARDGAVIMLGLADNRFGETSSNTLVFVDDVNAACARVPDVGGNVLDEPPTTPGACDRPSSPTRKVIAGNSPSTYATSTPPAGAPNRSGRFPVD
jgi:hypothetical protein